MSDLVEAIAKAMWDSQEAIYASRAMPWSRVDEVSPFAADRFRNLARIAVAEIERQETGGSEPKCPKCGGLHRDRRCHPLRNDIECRANPPAVS